MADKVPSLSVCLCVHACNSLRDVNAELKQNMISSHLLIISCGCTVVIKHVSSPFFILDLTIWWFHSNHWESDKIYCYINIILKINWKLLVTDIQVLDKEKIKSQNFNFSLTFKKAVLCKCIMFVSSDDCTTNPLRQSYPDNWQRPCNVVWSVHSPPSGRYQQPVYGVL